DDLSKPDGLHNIMGSPILQAGHVYGVCISGELRCLKADNGARVWEHLTTERETPFATTFIVPPGDRAFPVTRGGELIHWQLSPKGYKEIDRAHVIEATLFSRGRDVVWTHPAFAKRCVYVRNDRELICLSMKA